MKIQIMVYVYMAVCACMILFNLVYIMVYNRRDGSGLKRDDKFKKNVRDQIMNTKHGVDITPKEIKKLTRKCSDMWNLAAWDEELTELSHLYEDTVKDYVFHSLDMFLALADVMKKKEAVQQAHFAYIIYKYKIYEYYYCKAIVLYMLELVQSQNLYCRENALKVLYAYGDVDYVEQALDYVEENKSFHHEKLLVDGLLTFAGDKYELMNRLIQGRKHRSLKMQRVVLNYVRYGSSSYRELFWNMLQDPKEDDECKYIAIRYFGKYHDEEAWPILLKYAQYPDEQTWEYAAIAATSLGSYEDPLTVTTLKQCLYHKNWYIRYNAAMSLETFELSDTILQDVLNSNDRYAKEILEYLLKLRKYHKEAKEVSACQ